MNRYLISILLFTLVSVSCRRNSENASILSKKDFVNLLVDIHIFDAYATDHSLSQYINNIDSLSLYKSIFAKYNTDIESFQATMDWYSEKPEKFNEIYDEVFSKVNHINQEINSQLDLFNNPVNKKQISKVNRYYHIQGDTARYPEPFVFKTDGKGTYLISAQIRMLEIDKSIDPRIYAYFYKDEKDNNPDDRIQAVDFPMQKSNFSRDYQFICELKDRNYNYLKVEIPQVKNDSENFMKNMQLSSMKVFYLKEEDSKSEEPGDSLKAAK